MAWGSPGSYQAVGAAPSRQVPMQIPKKVIRINEQANWSTYRYAHAAALEGQEDAVFQTAQGSIGQGFATQLSLAETSLNENGRISNARSFLVDCIALHPYYQGGQGITTNSPSAEDLYNLQAHCVVAWKFLQTLIEISPAVLIGSGGGVFGASADTGGNYGGSGSQVALNNGNASLWFYRKNPVMLPGGTNFSIRYVWGDFASPVDGGPQDADLCLKTLLLGTYETAVPMG